MKSDVTVSAIWVDVYRPSDVPVQGKLSLIGPEPTLNANFMEMSRVIGEKGPFPTLLICISK